jgi:DNA-binding response OmpR family regulator
MKKILVIEDELSMRRNMLRLLQLEGYAACGAPDGEAGLLAVRTEHPDLVLCDVMMPRLDGFGVLAALRSDPTTRSLPFIFLTARGEKRDIRAGMNQGANDYLTKPVDAADLLAAIQTRLNLAAGG